MSGRFQGDEKREFEKAVDIIAKIDHNNIASRYLSAPILQVQLFDKEIAKGVFESASKIVNLFKRIMDDHFAAEIPELNEVCPKCRSLDIYVSSFSEENVNSVCCLCHHTWTESR